jgi:DNA-binding transcriptional ArsR family regulator
MPGDADIATVGAALADNARASMLLALVGGESLTAGELARRTGLSPPGASNHLRRLERSGLISAERVGRNRYVRLANDNVAAALEALAQIAPQQPVRSLRQAESAHALAFARTCYDHLAGRLGVSITDALVERRILTLDGDNFDLTHRGEAWLGTLGIDANALRRRRRSVARACLDWTERRPHLAGSAGAALATGLFTQRSIARLPGSRAVRITPTGATWLEHELGITTLN